MGLKKPSWLCWVFVGLCMKAAYCDGTELDCGITSECDAGEISYTGLQDGNHTFEVCANGSLGCANYSWTVDTVPPTAYVTAATPFTSAPYVTVSILFSKPCAGGGGFRCASVDACNLRVNGSGQVSPSTLNILQPNLKYSLSVHSFSSAQYGRLVLVMDKNFCTDAAGNKFIRTANSSFLLHFDRRSVSVNLTTRVPERQFQLNSETRTVQATSNYENLKVYLYFTGSFVNSSTEILNSVHTSQGSLVPLGGDTLQNRRFGFQVENVTSMAIVTVSFDSNSVVSRQGTPVSPVAPVTFLYDAERPAVRLITTSENRTRHKTILVFIYFMKPVFGFNSSHISLAGGRIQRFEESKGIYTVEIEADDELSINIPENITEDVAGNKNLASNFLLVKHYDVPVISSVLSSSATAAFVATASVAGLLTVSTSSLLAVGDLSRRSSPLVTDPARNLFRIASHIQIFALSRQLAVPLPVEYSEFARGLQWSIPSLSLPWATGHIDPSKMNPYSNGSKVNDSGIIETLQPQRENMDMVGSVYRSPLSPKEYISNFKSQNIKREPESRWDPNYSNGWRDFKGSMFWLAIIGGSLVLLHVLLRARLNFTQRRPANEKNYGALVFPRFEIFLINLALPCVCDVSAALVRGVSSSGAIVGILLLGVVAFLQLSLLLFLSIGVTFGKLLEYKEVHQEGQKFQWYQGIASATLGPGERGQWTWKEQSDSVYLTMLGPLFEDLRGPLKYTRSQVSGQTPQKRSNRIIDMDKRPINAVIEPLTEDLRGAPNYMRSQVSGETPQKRSDGTIDLDKLPINAVIEPLTQDLRGVPNYMRSQVSGETPQKRSDGTIDLDKLPINAVIEPLTQDPRGGPNYMRSQVSGETSQNRSDGTMDLDKFPINPMIEALTQDLKGPPNYMRSQVSGETPQKRSDRTIDLDKLPRNAVIEPLMQDLRGPTNYMRSQASGETPQNCSDGTMDLDKLPINAVIEPLTQDLRGAPNYMRSQVLGETPQNRSDGTMDLDKLPINPVIEALTQDLRGPLNYMHSQVSGQTPQKRGDRTIDLDKLPRNAVKEPLMQDLRGAPNYLRSQVSGETPQKRSDGTIDLDNETEDAEAPFIQKLFGILRVFYTSLESIRRVQPFIQKLFGILRVYYTSLESIRRVSLGIVVGAKKMGNTYSRTPTIILLCITSFQLFLMVLNKPFVKKRVQLVEIVSVSSELGILATCLVLLEKESSAGDQKKIGIFMLFLFSLMFLAQMINELYSLYRQTKQLDPAKGSFLFGLKAASMGFLLFFTPENLMNLDSSFPMNNRRDGEAGDVASSGDRNRSSGSRSGDRNRSSGSRSGGRNRSSGSRSSGSMDIPRQKQPSKIAMASLSEEGTGDQNDPSTSRVAPSEFYGGKRIGSSSLTSSTDFQSKPEGLHKDLEAISDPSDQDMTIAEM
ncbi:hypothetical protein RJ640_005193 [Escallonia rubra]|uniref:Bacterial Ig-like domain-containing protein n=1 Tax=Escallonia rubra TaxID=112253 RepID=A0AA88UPI6_9ASTE|nr:hypothetical protein RJ640_005193 [Escallonia rubra]